MKPLLTAVRRGSYVPVGHLSISLTGISADTDHVVVHDGRTGPEIARLDSAPWTYVWPAAEEAESPTFRAVDEAGNTSGGYRTGYVADGHPPMIEEMMLETVLGAMPVNGRIGRGPVLVPRIFEANQVTGGGGRDGRVGTRLLDRHQEVRQEDQVPTAGVRPGGQRPHHDGPYLVPLTRIA